MFTPRIKGNIAPREIKIAAERASALLAAVFIMLTLLLRGALPGEVAANVTAIAEANGPARSKEAGPTPDPSLWIRLAEVDKDVGPEVVIKLMGLQPAGSLDNTGGGPKILVYHTHDTEAYRMTETDVYEASGSCRTEDAEHNVLAVGEELCRILREEYGIYAIHACERHEKPLLTSAYSRSLETMRYYKRMYPSLEMFIDLHRDGVDDTGFEKDFVTVDGLECARMMFVVGTGKSGKSSQFAPEESDTEHDMPDFESNYALALRLTETLLSYNDRFMRSVRVKSGKYNQQVSDKCLLVEVGHNANTLEQAKNSMKYLARAISELAAGGG
ncbi:MAG: stage II sporulation protein P [Clostridia bacterium]|nr:stage II sporulation protein P [Clostridia bacterium]